LRRDTIQTRFAGCWPIIFTVHSSGPGNLADSVLLHPAMLPQAEAQGCQKGTQRSRRPQISSTPWKCLQRKGEFSLLHLLIFLWGAGIHFFLFIIIIITGSTGYG
jgi:hypothetical protein